MCGEVVIGELGEEGGWGCSGSALAVKGHKVSFVQLFS